MSLQRFFTHADPDAVLFECSNNRGELEELTASFYYWVKVIATDEELRQVMHRFEDLGVAVEDLPEIAFKHANDVLNKIDFSS